jgi:hypothetical protein
MIHYPRTLWSPPEQLCVDPPAPIKLRPKPHRTPAEGGSKPRVYLAGKIRKNCWRHELIDDLRSSSWDDGPLELPGFRYVGPFYVGCDHGCYHGPTSHGCGRHLLRPDGVEREQVAMACQAAIRQSDLVFCFIESLDCYGTLVEIGWAQMAGVPVVMAFAPGVASAVENELHLACAHARGVFFDVRKGDLQRFLDIAVQECKP